MLITLLCFVVAVVLCLMILYSCFKHAVVIDDILDSYIYVCCLFACCVYVSCLIVFC